MSHLYVTLDVEGGASMPTHHDILEEESARVNHVIDVFLICQRIVAIGRAGINIGEFQEGTPGRLLVKAMIRVYYNVNHMFYSIRNSSDDNFES